MDLFPASSLVIILRIHPQAACQVNSCPFVWYPRTVYFFKIIRDYHTL